METPQKKKSSMQEDSKVPCSSVATSGNITDEKYLPDKYNVFTPKNFVNTSSCESCGKKFGFVSGKHHWYNALAIH